MGVSFFFIFGAVGSGIMVISAGNPVFSLFWLVIVFINSAVFFLLLGVDFIALMFLLVYVGAIAVLFLFVIMLLNLTDYPPAFFKREADMTNYIPIGFLTGVFFFSEVSSSWFVLGPFQVEDWDLSFPWLIISYHNIEALGQFLYVIGFCLLIMASFVLLVSMMGAIGLGQETSGPAVLYVIPR
uniref:NADH dehydrogenase subunit 6 n=1 Tax=Caryophyllia scobinosa TaxID=691193 RepID=UPI002176E8B4|nr:NADH dehydrogenase subunit 6 [Caryophyllia scobinosa]UUF92254.1 NADH dehydrogenase subunit 6 [Caryophyllia scobinosa]